MTHDELLNLTVAQRDWYLKRALEQREADVKAVREAQKEK